MRLSVLEGDNLTWVAVSQEATTGLRYDPGREQGVRVHPASTAGGRALLATMDDDALLSLVGRTGLRPDIKSETNAPTSIADLMATIEATRKRGYAIAVNTYIEGMGAMATAIRAGGRLDGQVLGCLSIAGPAVRLPETRMEALAPLLFEAANELGAAAAASYFFAGMIDKHQPTPSAQA